jgi:hypothetical protein
MRILGMIVRGRLGDLMADRKRVHGAARRGEVPPGGGVRAGAMANACIGRCIGSAVVTACWPRPPS